MWWISRAEWDSLVRTISLILRNLHSLEAQMAVDYTRLKTDIAAQTSVITSVLVLIRGLQQMIADLKAQLPDDSAAQAILDQAAADLEANTTQLTQAVPVNTSATTETTPVVPAPPPTEETPVDTGFTATTRARRSST